MPALSYTEQGTTQCLLFDKMAAKIGVVLLIVLWESFTHIKADKEEYCNGERFRPECSDGDIIIMQSALYGRMQVGRCIPEDLGYMGCRSDVLGQFDEACSGRTSCEVWVTDANIKEAGGCRKGLLRYLEASYICKQGLDVPNFCSTNRPISIDVDRPELYLSSRSLDTSCIQTNKAWTLQAKEGQVMNISVINLQHGIRTRDAVFGSVKDPLTNRRVVFGDGVRYSHLLVSASHRVDVVVQHSNAHFLLHITVSGCPNMPPPSAAWMTRHGDVMEVGCHSGDKSWTLTCEGNQWIGAVGQCGRTLDRATAPETGAKDEELSPNVVIFGVCSLVILLSAMIFMAGVCILKRKLRRPTSVLTQEQKSVDLNVAMGCGSLQTTCAQPGYKSLMLLNLNDSVFLTGGGGDEAESVKYYALDDSNKSGLP